MRWTGRWLMGLGVLAVGLLAAAEPPGAPPADPGKVKPPQVAPPTGLPDTTPLTPDQAKAKVEELRKRYAFESIAGRLDYEPAGAEAFAKSEPAPKVTADTLKRLDAAEQGMANYQRWNLRARSLQILHSDQAQKFIERDGFGLSRMPTPSPVLLELAASPTIPFDAARETASNGDKDPKPAARAPKDDELAAFQQQGLFDFLNPRGFGFVKDREHVAGFQSHQFRQMPFLPASDKAPSEQTEKWAVLRLELVSLLKHEQPVVYVTSTLPRMGDTNDAPTRPLIPFEEKGLKALKAGDDLATETSGDHIRMVGSLRASKQCLDCHQVNRGDLLGAFSWELQRQPFKDTRLP